MNSARSALRTGCANVLSLSYIIYLITFSFSFCIAFAQTPPATDMPPMEPGGSVKLKDFLIQGFRRFPQGQAPFGTLSDGSPYWPYLDVIPQQTTPSPTPTGPIATETNPLEFLEKLLSLPFTGNLTPNTFRNIAVSGNEETAQQVPWPRQGPQVDLNELRKLQRSFLFDLVSHARAVYEGDNVKAFMISSKWQDMAKRYPDRIGGITYCGAKYCGFSNFASWIDNAVIADWQACGNTGLPPILLTDATASVDIPAPAIPATPATDITPSRVSTVITDKLQISILSPGELELIENSLDLNGPGAKAPMLEIIDTLTGGDDGALEKLSETCTSGRAAIIQNITDFFKTKLESDWGTPLTTEQLNLLESLAEALHRRLTEEVTLQQN